MHRFLVLILVLLSLTLIPITARGDHSEKPYEQGDKIYVFGYCIEEESMLKATEAVAQSVEEGSRIFTELCHLTGPESELIFLVKKEYEVTDPNGDVFEIWLGLYPINPQMSIPVWTPLTKIKGPAT